MARAFVAAVRAGGVRGADVRFGRGTHTWPYWRQDLREFLAWLEPGPRGDRLVRRPAVVAVRSARPAFTAWGWRFTAHRTAAEFTYVRRATRRGLAVTGSGRLDVRTPPLFAAGAAYRAGGRLLCAGRSGRLGLSLDLGPAHRHPQSTFGARPPAGWRTVRVALERVQGARCA